MAISRVQAVSANATSATLSATNANDLILVFAFSNSGSTFVTDAAGYTQIDNAAAGTGGSGASGHLCYKFATAGETTTGTWTNAAAVTCIVLRGVAASPIGGHNPQATTSSTVTFGALTMSVTDGTSWVLAFGGAKAASTGMTASTAVLTNVTNVTTANALSSEAGLTSYAGETLTTSGGNRCVGFSVEILASVSVVLAGAGRANAAGTGALTNTLSLTGAAAGTAKGTTVLTNAPRLAGAGVSVARFTGDLKQPFAGNGQGRATGNAALTTGFNLAGVSRGVASSSAVLNIPVDDSRMFLCFG